MLLYVKLHNLSINFKDLKLFSFVVKYTIDIYNISYGRVGFYDLFLTDLRRGLFNDVANIFTFQ